MPRRRAAATLWSNLDGTTGLARLRNTLHDLRRGFAAAGIDPLALDNDSVWFRPGEVVVEPDGTASPDRAPTDRGAEYLVDLDGIDPALDRWLRRIRDDRRHPISAPASIELAADEPDARPHADTGPSIVVTQFETAGTQVDAQFAKAFTDAVTVALAKFRWFRTIVQSNPGKPPPIIVDDLARIADYALVGRLQRSEGQYRLTINLIALKNPGAVVWASSLVQERRPGFAEQERLANAIAARLDSELLLIEAERQRRRPSRRQESTYALVLQAVPAIHRLDRDPFLGAGHVLEQAVSADSESALAHSWLAYWHVFFVGQGWATNRLQAMTQGGRAAERAMMLDPKDARAVTTAGHVKAFLSRRLDEATALHELALQLNPALPLAWHFSGMTHAYAGRLEDAFRCISQCLELAPTAPHGFFAEGALGIVHLLRGDHEAAIAIGRRVTERQPHFTSALKSYLAALGYLGRRTEAAEILKRLTHLEPGFSLRSFRAGAPYQRTQDIAHFMGGLRLAGVT